MRLIGVDVGGTFTDVVFADTETGVTLIHKVPTTPDDPSRGVVAGIVELCRFAELPRATIDHVLHGTTIGTNAVLEHDGAVTGMITTAGYRDIVHIGRHQRPQHYSIRQEIPWQNRPLVLRRHRHTVPERLVPVIERLAQNLFICPSTIAQYAALACFESSSLLEYERRRAEFKARRDYFIPALNALGLTVPVIPDGAFYAWADCSNACRAKGLKDSWDLAFDLMQHAHVAVTPGRDFGRADAHNFIRFSTASSMAQLHEAVARLKAYLEPLK